MFSLTGGNIEWNGDWQQHYPTGVYIEGYVDFTISGKGNIHESNSLRLDDDSTISVPDFLTNEKVATIKFENQTTGTQVLNSASTSRPQINYYKFSVYPDTGWCINANGQASQINYYDALSFITLENLINGFSRSDQTQYIRMDLASASIEGASNDVPINVKTGCHIRIVSTTQTESRFTIGVFNSVIQVNAGGHLLIDGNSNGITLDFEDTARGNYPAIRVNAGGSIVIHGMYMRNAYTNNSVPSMAPLVNGAVSTISSPTYIVLDSFTFDKENAGRWNSSTSALVLPSFTRCYFVNGFIRGFTNNAPNFGGLANLSLNSEFWVLGGDFTDNTLAPPDYSSSVSFETGEPKGKLTNTSGKVLR